MIYKLIGSAGVGVLLGIWMGMAFERSDWVDHVKELEEKAAEDLKAAEIEHIEKLSLARQEHQRTVDRFREILQEVRESEARARRIAESRQERIDEIETELESLSLRFTGRSHCVWDGDDVGLWNESIEAVNRSIRQRMSGGAYPEPS